MAIQLCNNVVDKSKIASLSDSRFKTITLVRTCEKWNPCPEECKKGKSFNGEKRDDEMTEHCAISNPNDQSHLILYSPHPIPILRDPFLEHVPTILSLGAKEEKTVQGGAKLILQAEPYDIT